MGIRKEYLSSPELEMVVFHEDIYKGEQPLKIVGIRKEQIELQGDFSGGTHNLVQESWMPIKGAFRIRKCCPQKENPNGCQLHNLHCAYPKCEPYITPVSAIPI